MAFALVNYTTAGATATDLTIDKPTGVAKGDFLFNGIVASSASPTSVPSGWALIADNTFSSIYGLIEIYYKIAGASEPADYTWSYANSQKRVGSITAFRGDFNTSNPIDVVSNTNYEVSNQTIRAASMTITDADSPVIFAGFVDATASTTFTPPSGFSEVLDYGNYTQDKWITIAWDTLGSGATGSIDGTLNTSRRDKHAFAIALDPNPASESSVGLFFGLSP